MSVTRRTLISGPDYSLIEYGVPGTAGNVAAVWDGERMGGGSAAVANAFPEGTLPED